MSDVWIINREYMSNTKKNGNKLPTALVKRCIDFTTRPGALVFDPFMGNATTAVASIASFRNYFGAEINNSVDIHDVHTRLIDSTVPGCMYTPYINNKPSDIEILERYPNLRKYIKHT